MLEYKFDTQLLIDGKDLSEDAINEYITQHIKGDCLLAVGDETLIKIHYHTNEPWQVLEYCASLGEIYDVVVENIQPAWQFEVFNAFLFFAEERRNFIGNP